MTFAQFNTKIGKQIRELSDGGRLQFALDICKRLLPEYETFHKEYNWGNPEILERGIGCCEQILNGDKADNYKIEEIIKLIDEVTPDTEDFGGFEVSYALNTCVAIVESLEYILDKNVDHIVSVSTSMTDTIDFKIAENFGHLSEGVIDDHPWMVSERNNQIALTK